jgi:ATP-dependent RNA helicase DDX10/DBP4
VQIFEVVRVVGAYHQLSAGLLVGGKKEFYIEQRHVGRTNIFIATPGRLLQHLEQTPDLDTSQVKVLVLDEADRILDMGFREQLIRILEYLPPGSEQVGGRQTLLFSATQTRKVSDLAALSLHKPEYLGVHDKEKNSTPESLMQSMVTVPLEHKLNAVYSFVKSHLRSKSILFLASCSQVRHAWELFCALQPGIPIMALHGKLAQERRTKIYFDFLQRPHAVMFATDVAARGLDFPNVDWVVQVDAPEDKEMYIHRVGRTARYTSGGKSLLMVTPGEEAGMTKALQDAKVPIKKLSINPTKTVLVTQRAASLVASNVTLNTLAKKAFKSYVRSVHLMPDKDVFNVEDLPLDGFAASLGLSATPNVRFLQKVKDRTELRGKKNVNRKLQKLKDQIKAEKLAEKIGKMGGKRSREDEPEQNDEDNLLVVKSRYTPLDDEEEDLPDPHLHEVTKSRHAKKIRIDGSSGANKRIIFNDEGQEQTVASLLTQNESQVAAEIERVRDSLESANDDYLRKVMERLHSTAGKDRAEEKDRIREKHRKRRLQERGEKENDEAQGEAVTLPLGDADDSEGESEASAKSESSEDESENEVDVKAQEDLALAVIRNSS